jgi:phosphocarrier protein FPr
MKECELVIQNQTGLHARPAKVLVGLAKQFTAEIQLWYGEKSANAKSIIAVLGLGVISGGRVKLKANGSDEELALATVASAIQAGLGDAHPPAEKQPETAPLTPSITPATNGAMPGIAVSPGIAIGPIFHFRPANFDLEDWATLSGNGQMSLTEALVTATTELAELQEQMARKHLQAEAAIFEAHSALLDDPELRQSVQVHLNAGWSAPKAWKLAVAEQAAAIEALSDPVLAARASDLRDVGRRVLRLLLGANGHPATPPPTPVVVIAEELSPSDTASFNPEHILGVGLVNGGPTSHVAILARAMGLPAIVGLDASVLTLAEQTLVILNGTDGILTPNPALGLITHAEQTQRRWQEQRRLAQSQAALPATSLDGHRIEITANAGSVADAKEAVTANADGIGLLRTEFLFLERETAPTETEQFQVYQAIAETMGARPVIIRTLDIGGDKPLPYIQLKPEMNPFLGERGIRLCLNRPELFREQVRAILRAAPCGNLRVMIPMVSDVAEVRQARALIEEERRKLNAPSVPFGIMVEVPSAALLAHQLAPEIDFFSIGTNDLTQYTLAIDRAHPALAAKHDGLHPAVLNLIAQTVAAAHHYGKRADLCGELGSDELAVPILLGLGLDELSVSIPAVPTVKALVRTLSLAETQTLAREALLCATAPEVRALVKNYLNSKKKDYG